MKNNNPDKERDILVGLMIGQVIIFLADITETLLFPEMYMFASLILGYYSFFIVLFLFMYLNLLFRRKVILIAVSYSFYFIFSSLNLIVNVILGYKPYFENDIIFKVLEISLFSADVVISFVFLFNLIFDKAVNEYLNRNRYL